jgi:hypothetical protein
MTGMKLANALGKFGSDNTYLLAKNKTWPDIEDKIC